jgi:phage terminase large subunit GpA-like protein
VTAAVITPAVVVREAHAVLHAAMRLEWPAHGPALKAVASAVVDLGDALEVYRALDGDALHWDAVWPHLRDEADPDGEALRKAADEAASAADDLTAIIAAHCGTRIEDEMKNAGSDQ